MFRNRTHAAQLLAQRLEQYRGTRPLVLAIPRGAVPMGKVIADALGGDLDVVLVHKIGAPGNPELAVGAVSETGRVHISPHAAEFGASRDYVNREAQEHFRRLQERRRRYTPNRKRLDTEGRVVIVVDDGVATGFTMRAALVEILETDPSRLIVAVGVASQDAVEQLDQIADEVVCLEIPDVMYAVGQAFEEFEQVSDEEVIRILRA